ncbi:MAG: hypothetical protein WC076_04695 [Terrimicrobiaceae bacterium]|nr:hypothetical protein [Terrimicrobiaceae bacterium]
MDAFKTPSDMRRKVALRVRPNAPLACRSALGKYGAGAIVLHDVRALTLVAGNPAVAKQLENP